jgi:uncharacterized protein YneF (UPF0154 family)
VLGVLLLPMPWLLVPIVAGLICGTWISRRPEPGTKHEAYE